MITFGANLKTISVWRSTSTISDRGSMKATWAYSHTVPLVDVQPVSSEKRPSLKGSETSSVYQCFVDGTADIDNGDQVIDPLSSDVIPSLEVFNSEKWPSADGLPAHTRFFLRRIK